MRISPLTRSGTTTRRPLALGMAQRSAGPLKAVVYFFTLVGVCDRPSSCADAFGLRLEFGCFGSTEGRDAMARLVVM